MPAGGAAAADIDEKTLGYIGPCVIGDRNMPAVRAPKNIDVAAEQFQQRRLFSRLLQHQRML
jgi:hypothetical protein